MLSLSLSKYLLVLSPFPLEETIYGFSLPYLNFSNTTLTLWGQYEGLLEYEHRETVTVHPIIRIATK
jgi:hypothetical protein